MKSHGFHWGKEGDELRVLWIEEVQITVEARAEGVAVSFVIFDAFVVNEDGSVDSILKMSFNWDPFVEGVYLNGFLRELAS